MTETLAPLPGRVVTWFAWRPEWPAVLVAAGAWTWLALAPAAGAHTSHLTPSGHGSMSMSTAPAPMSLATWSLMCTAMLVPLALPALRHVSLNSPRGSRWASMLLFGVGYLLPWTVLGAVALPVTGLMMADGLSAAALGVGIVTGAALWQPTSYKRFAVLSCSRTVPLAPSGVRAWWGRVEFGLRQSLRCMAACWPLMLLMVVVPHGVVGAAVMAVLTGVMVVEMQSRRRRLLLPWLTAPLGGAALVLGVVAW